MGRDLFNFGKTAILMGAMMGLFVAVGGMFGEGFLIPALLFGGGLNLVAFFFSDTIAIKSMRGREVTAENGGDLYRMVDRLRQRAGLPMPRVYLTPHQAPNAFATGRSPKRSAVAMTQGAVDLMQPHELEGVIAHELAHIKHRDTLISTMAGVMAGVLAFLAQWGLFFGGARGRNPLATIAVVILGAVGAAVLKAAISRSREFAADAEGARIAGSPTGLMSALATLENANRRIPMRGTNSALHNLFIIEPFGGDTLAKLFATHPPTEKRLAALRKVRPEA
jgi:heat shock protein HtpX